ncbi:MAG: tetratricopeptide repeat protein [Acidobacteriota bacterium]
MTNRGYRSRANRLSSASKRRAAAIAGGAFLWLLGACSTLELGDPIDRAAMDRILIQRGVDPSRVVLPYAIRDDMSRWAEETVDGLAVPEERLMALSRRLLDPDELPVEYVWGYTGTAEEVFDRREANCLAFTNLFVGMARSVGLDTYFLAVNNVESFRKEGDLVIVSDHVAVGFGEPGRRTVLDFSEERGGDLRFARRISDLTAIAMYHSNRGAESLQRGSVDEALGWLRVAVQIDDRLVHAWVNLGVAERRAGRLDEAEAAYHRALALDPMVESASQNLASLLRFQGRVKIAEAYQTVLGQAESQNPYTYLSLGDLSLRGGRPIEARRFYRRAVDLAPIAETYAALGQAVAAAGDLRQARRLLRKAQRAGGGGDRVEALARLLDR